MVKPYAFHNWLRCAPNRTASLKNLLATGMTVEQVVDILGLSAEQQQQL